MKTSKNHVENYIEKLASENREKCITHEDIEKLILLMLSDDELEKLNFENLTDRFSLISLIMTKVYLENRYRGN